jgi:hypothetical protein
MLTYRAFLDTILASKSKDIASFRKGVVDNYFAYLVDLEVLVSFVGLFGC